MVMVIGHRGASRDHPENTVAAFVGAREQGADWVELDVRATLDGALVVHHDPLLADGRVIADTTHADLPASVPTLVSALEACRPMGVNVEIKNSAAEPGHDPSQAIALRTVDAIRSIEGPLDVLISSFELPTLAAARSADPSIPTGYLVLAVDEPLDAIGTAVAAGHAAVHPFDAFVTETVVGRCRDAGLRIYVWTVDDPDRIAELARWGVDGVITNVPAVARRVLGPPAAPR